MPHIDWSKADFGSLPDWVAACTAALALLVAAIAAKATVQTNRAQQKTLELQRQQFEDARNQIKRSQASKVSFYTETAARHIMVSNASDAPIYWLRLVYEPT